MDQETLFSRGAALTTVGIILTVLGVVWSPGKFPAILTLLGPTLVTAGLVGWVFSGDAGS